MKRVIFILMLYISGCNSIVDDPVVALDKIEII